MYLLVPVVVSFAQFGLNIAVNLIRGVDDLTDVSPFQENTGFSSLDLSLIVWSTGIPLMGNIAAVVIVARNYK